MAGLHSPFGIFGQIKDRRGLTTKQLLWGESWITLLLESADAPRYVNGKADKKPVFASVEDFGKWLKSSER